ncbi:histidinol-phosphate transaminase [Allomyces macrogynus ATCC 38327]|uniref:histidinol-phosphate transaminase n=1 Tax=Allomyces macrogynus (strain ATCC 38327) TaxID=578462 RepID=A0A0L0RWJ4_ALLM3|nr:histidinol-phosphate transaminase [Allomyces macrogynus ATCC 38327]|eukprot:KNE54465.1 histidinol-phosphate transaminase [Allomyces macrogynus ATCC 38327]
MSPKNFSLEALIRPNILKLKPYRCARDDYSEGILLDANENAFGPSVPAAAHHDLPDTLLARYPDPYQRELKAQLADWRGLTRAAWDHVFLGVGSDEVLDIVMRVACTPGTDKILVCPPTYGMYTVSADINDVEVVKVPLDVDRAFALDVDAVLKALQADAKIKVVFLCSPGNPTGSALVESDVRRILDFDGWNGLVVVDEAYIDFADQRSAVALVKQYPNLLVSQTFSKSFGMAGVRLGVAYAQPPLIAVLSKTKAPYNISNPTAQLGLAAMSPQGLATFTANIAAAKEQRARLLRELPKLPRAGKILGTSDANFVLIQVLGKDGRPCNATALALYKALAEAHKVVVRFRGNDYGCNACVRVTVGTPEEVDYLLAKWRAHFTAAKV